MSTTDMSLSHRFERSGIKEWFGRAEAWLDGLVANRLPKSVGRIGLGHVLSANGGVRSEFTIMRDGPDRFYLVSAGAGERHDGDTLVKSLPEIGVRLEAVTTQYGVLVLAGPKSRNLLAKLTDADLSNEAFPWLTGRFVNVGTAQARAMRVNLVADMDAFLATEQCFFKAFEELLKNHFFSRIALKNA